MRKIVHIIALDTKKLLSSIIWLSLVTSRLRFLNRGASGPPKGLQTGAKVVLLIMKKASFGAKGQRPGDKKEEYKENRQKKTCVQRSIKWPKGSQLSY